MKPMSYSVRVSDFRLDLPLIFIFFFHVDPDFQETTRTLLADISAARGQPIPVIPASSLSSPNHSAPIGPSTPEPIKYPFNLILTSATIPKSLNAYLEKHHPSLIRLASPRLHHLPKTLQTEHVNWTGGNKFPDILRRIRKIWAEDAAFSRGSGGLSKVLLFCNKSAKVVDLSAYLTEQGVNNVAMTSQSEHRGRGSNKHLEGFLRTRNGGEGPIATTADVKDVPHVMVTTSILSRGLDFSPDIKHVFIIDEPRNTIDFLHRAGRTGRAGQQGKVVIFGKLKGRGSQRAKDTKKRIGALAA
jgi:ATP-dependent RNA helicase MRH4